MIKTKQLKALGAIFAFAMPLLLNPLSAAKGENNKRIFDHWTAERMAKAMPRDLVIDERGLGYLRAKDGSLVPYGHNKVAQLSVKGQTPFAKPPSGGGNSDTTAPSISEMDPANGDEIGADHTFSALISDTSGLKSISFAITYPSGTTQSFSPGYNGTSGRWEISLSGFTDGGWSWKVIAKDGAAKGGNTATSNTVNFTVDTRGSGDGSGSGDTGGGSAGAHVVTNERWGQVGDIHTAAGRIYFEMPGNAKRKGPWAGYVCSGTVVTDGDTGNGRSIIITAAHCVYDDANKAFARNVIFIPNQDQTSGSGTDRDCSNDPIGCWTTAFGVINDSWSTATFPDNAEWDYAYYVVSDTDAHEGNIASSNALDEAVGLAMTINFGSVAVNDDVDSDSSSDFTHGLGYSYSNDPFFMYCADDMTTEGEVNWWLPYCELSGGSSGGPWIQPIAGGNGPIISVNSWGYTNGAGMAGPKLTDSTDSTVVTAQCVFNRAVSAGMISESADGDAGYKVSNCP